MDESAPGLRRRRRSKAWIYYTLLTAGSFLALCSGQVIGLAGIVLFGAYAYYLYNGGSIVIWFW
jgi:hypothetical protein